MTIWPDFTWPTVVTRPLVSSIVIIFVTNGGLPLPNLLHSEKVILEVQRPLVKHFTYIGAYDLFCMSNMHGFQDIAIENHSTLIRPFKVIQGQSKGDHLVVHIWFAISVQ